jgi:hypothetical protein
MAAEKTPDTIYTTRLGNYRLIIANYSDTNIDDNDYWTSGIHSKVAHWVGHEVDASDLAIDSYTVSTGLMTFGCTANWEGQICILCKDN